jgi:hypothetical protein
MFYSTISSSLRYSEFGRKDTIEVPVTIIIIYMTMLRLLLGFEFN